jgi:hypothetical protein
MAPATTAQTLVVGLKRSSTYPRFCLKANLLPDIFLQHVSGNSVYYVLK